MHSEGPAVAVRSSEGVEQAQDAIGSGERQRAEKNGVDEAEDGGVPADAEGEGQDHGHRESGRSAQQA